MKRRSIVLSAMALTIFMWSSDALKATPDPSPVPVSWELTLKPAPPMRIQVDLGSGLQTYWYMLYTVVNNTSKDIDFQPEIERVSEIQSEVPADRAASMPEQASKITTAPAMVGVHPRVFAAIKKLHAKTYPFLVAPVEAITRLRQGRDNALTSVAVFKNLDPRVSKFTIYFGGLSGEKTLIRNPAYQARKVSSHGQQKSRGRQAAKPKYFVVRKTLAIPYTLPGDVKTRRYATPALGRITWVMR